MHARPPLPASGLLHRSALKARLRSILDTKRGRGLAGSTRSLLWLGAVLCLLPCLALLGPIPRATALAAVRADGESSWWQESRTADGAPLWSRRATEASEPLSAGLARKAQDLLERSGGAGTVVVHDVSSGELLSFVSVGSPSGTRRGPVPAASPGSVRKLALAALWWETQAKDEALPCSGSATLWGVEVKDAGGLDRGLLDGPHDMLVLSCNTAAASLATRLGERLGWREAERALSAYGLSGSTPSASREDWLAAVVGLREVKTTTLDVSRFLQAIGNGGLALAGKDPAAAAAPERLLSAVTAAKLQAAMSAVVSEGTGRRAAPLLEWSDWQLAGKTGTTRGAQGLDGWFGGLAFDPDASPRYTVVVHLEGGGTGGGKPASLAAEMTRYLARATGGES